MAVYNILYLICPLSTRIEKGYTNKMIPFFFFVQYNINNGGVSIPVATIAVITLPVITIATYLPQRGNRIRGHSTLYSGSVEVHQLEVFKVTDVKCDFEMLYLYELKSYLLLRTR